MRPRKLILLVDANEQTLSQRAFLLETRGYRVVKAESSQSALDILARMAPHTLDLLIADLMLPEMDGDDLVRRAKQLHPALQSLIVSSADLQSAALLLDRVRALAARKRGPKKRTPVVLQEVA